MATKLTIAGFKTCSYYVRARTALQGLQVLQSPNLTVEVVEHEDRDSYKAWWATFKPKFGVRAETHASSPAVWLGEADFLGGHDDTLAWIRSNYMAGAAVSKPPRVVHGNDPRTPEDGAGFDYDLVVIGGGSGGLAASQEAVRAHPGLRVAVLDFVKPSWVGTTWGLGGTCVNVGCIPKKLMHNAALLGDSLTDASAFGWSLPPKGEIKHSWEKLVQGVQDHIASINFSYRVALREVGVKYENALGAFKDPHTLTLTDKKGKTKEVTTRRVIIAVGGRPTKLDIPGGELALSSDDLFSLPTPPGKTLVVGASYVALECAGFLAGMGYDTTVMVRSILLRGFDAQCADMIGDHMEAHGAKFQRSRVPTRIEKTEDGKLRVFSKNVSEGGAGGDGEFSDVYDTVFTAVGRYADTAKLNLEAAGVVASKDGKLVTVGEQTNVPHIYAIGDVVKGAPELTPVAIAAGKYLARRLYGKSTEGMDYDRIATTVFTPLEYGTVGLSEEAAKEKLGEDSVEVFHSFFTPLEHTIVEERPKNKCYAKLVINKKDQNRVVGFHVLGPNSGEITQGWACAVRLGATYESFLQTVGIHPTSAEEFTQLTVTKSSGESADKGNC